MRKIQGFTLIELVVCILILSILSAIALPRFLDLGHDTRESVIKGVAATLSSAADLGQSKGIIAGFEDQAWAGQATSDSEGREYHFGFPAIKPSGMPKFIALDTSNNLSKRTKFVWAGHDTYRPGYTAPVYMVFSYSDLVEANTHYPYPTTQEIESTHCFARYEIHALSNASGATVKVITDTSNC